MNTNSLKTTNEMEEEKQWMNDEEKKWTAGDVGTGVCTKINWLEGLIITPT